MNYDRGLEMYGIKRKYFKNQEEIDVFKIQKINCLGKVLFYKFVKELVQNLD